MPHQLTITAQTGPARQLTTAVVPNVTRMEFDLNDKVLSVFTDPVTGTTAKEFDLTGVTAVTFTITAGNYSVTVA